MRVQAYWIGGSVHVVLNNHVGFTTLPVEGRTSEHCTDTARAIGVPVIHANADDAEAVVRAFEVAAEWRARWQRDIIIDICGYRRATIHKYRTFRRGMSALSNRVERNQKRCFTDTRTHWFQS